jgi:hypothetical protein
MMGCHSRPNVSSAYSAAISFEAMSPVVIDE